MTAQISEKLLYGGATLSMCTQPLDRYFALADIQPGFDTRINPSVFRASC